MAWLWLLLSLWLQAVVLADDDEGYCPKADKHAKGETYRLLSFYLFKSLRSHFYVFQI